MQSHQSAHTCTHRQGGRPALLCLFTAYRRRWLSAPPGFVLVSSFYGLSSPRVPCACIKPRVRSGTYVVSYYRWRRLPSRLVLRGSAMPVTPQRCSWGGGLRRNDKPWGGSAAVCEIYTAAFVLRLSLPRMQMCTYIKHTFGVLLSFCFSLFFLFCWFVSDHGDCGEPGDPGGAD